MPNFHEKKIGLRLKKKKAYVFWGRDIIGPLSKSIRFLFYLSKANTRGRRRRNLPLARPVHGAQLAVLPQLRLCKESCV